MDQLAFPEADISSKSNCFYSTDLQARVLGGLPVAEKMNMWDNALYVGASYPIADMVVKGRYELHYYTIYRSSVSSSSKAEPCQWSHGSFDEYDQYCSPTEHLRATYNSTSAAGIR
jgi:hypothetical protein